MNKTIKLFVDAHSFDAGFQGTQTFIRELYTQILTDHPDVDVYWGIENPNSIKAIFPSVKPQNILLYRKRRPAILRFVFDIPAFIKKYQFDYAHFQYLSPLPQRGCQYIVTTHDVLFNDFSRCFSFAYRLSRSLLFGWSIKNAAIKTTVSNYSAGRIAAHYGIPQKQINVIPNGVIKCNVSIAKAKEHILTKYGIQNFILYVSRIEPRKNHVLLLDKYLKLKLYEQGIPLVFIGEESMMVADLKARIATLTDEQGALFYWLPKVEQDDLQSFYRACRLFVYPSVAEGFGIPPLEAAVCEVPVLCSSATAMADFDFFNSTSFDPNDTEEFELKLANVIQNPPSVNQLKRIAAQVAYKYSWQNSAAIFYQLLNVGLQPKPAKIQLIVNNIDALEATPAINLKY